MSNREILAMVELVLTTPIEYGLSVEYDADGKPIFKVAPTEKRT